jgi:hypothetical protein
MFWPEMSSKTGSAVSGVLGVPGSFGESWLDHNGTV